MTSEPRPSRPPPGPTGAALDGLTWRLLGPWRGGRVMAVAGHPTEDRTFYFGSTGGGVWRSGDAGVTWRNISDGYFRRAAVGAIAVAPSDPDTIWAGTGEGGLRGNVTGGDGVYLSRDGGETWSHRGLEVTGNIARVRVHPADPDLVYVAAAGHRFGPNPERGVYRSADAGRTWERVLHLDDRTGAIDLTMDTRNPRILYAALWEAGRTPWGFTSGGPGSGFHRTMDGGETWTPLTANPALPNVILGRIAVAVSPADSRRVYALIEAADRRGGLYRSSDRGETWTWVSAEPQLLVRPWYLVHLVADPVDPDTLYVPGRKLWKSIDAGRSWRQLNTTYWDQHDLWLDPRDPRRMILGNDGGATVSLDGGATWSTILNQPTAELYHVVADTRFPYRLYSAQQDNSTISLPSRSERGPISQADWYDVGGGESGFIAVRPDDPDIVYAASYAGEVTRYDHRTGALRTISVWPEASSGWGAGDLRERFNWSTPVVLSPHDPNVLYVCSNHVHRSHDEGASWEVFSPDLTRADPAKLAPAGGPITFDSSGTDYYCTIAAFAESPVRAGVLWAGSDDGLLHRSPDGGATWENVTPSGIPAWATVSAVEPSPHDPDGAYVAVAANKLDDFRPYLFRTADAGRTWTPIVAGIPDDEFCRTIRADPSRHGLLYAGSEAGVWLSFDDGDSWRPFRSHPTPDSTGALPVSPVYDLAVKDGDLIAATHGRGLWILDDVTPLHQLADMAPDAQVHLFRPRPAVRIAREAYGINSLIALGYPYGSDGPPHGVSVHYYLARPAERVTLTFLDAEDPEVISFTSEAGERPPSPLGPLAHRLVGAGAALAARGADEDEPRVRVGVLPPEMRGRGPDRSRPTTAAGLNRFVWDLRHPSARTLPGRAPSGITTPLAPPGRYGVRLTVDGDTRHETFEILPDPRLTTTPSDYAAQVAFMTAIRGRVTAIHQAVGRIEDLRRQLGHRLDRLPDDTSAPEIRRAATGLDERLTAIERALSHPALNDRAPEQASVHHPIGLDAQLATLGYWMAKSDAAPTRQARQVLDDLSARVERALAGLDDVFATDIEAINRLFGRVTLPAIVPPA